ncbi:MAG: MFS transporter [Desulfurococcales archaeon]|nr:MFS transporter [Desulfurococcales archaeon]
MRPLRLYSLLSNLAGGLANPFVGFFVVASNVPTYMVSLVSSASTALPGISQIAILRIKTDPRKMVILGTMITGIIWIVSGIVSAIGALFVGLYLTTQIVSGIASLGWSLILEKVSRGRRGFELARYSFYANAGSLLATLITGYLVGRNLGYIAYSYIATGTLLIISSLLILGYKDYNQSVDKDLGSVSYSERGKGKDRLGDLRRFYMVNFSYMIVMSLAWPLFPIAQVHKFGMSATEVGILTVISGVSTLALQRIVGTLVDLNRKIVMFSGRVLLASFPLGYALSTNVYQLYAVQIVSGFTNSAVIAYTSYVMDNSSDKRKALSMFNFLNGIGTIIGSVLGGALFTMISSAEDPVDAVDLLMLIIGIVRVIAAIPYLYVRDVKIL